MRENLVQFSSKQENKARIITFVNNRYQNYQVSLNYFFLSYYFRNITNCINKRYHSSMVSCQHRLYKRCKVIDETKTFWQYTFFSTNHLETHAICSIINKIYSNKRMAPNNKWKILTPLKLFYTYITIRWRYHTLWRYSLVSTVTIYDLRTLWLRVRI